VPQHPKHPKPSSEELWLQSVEHWLHHIETAYVERVLQTALEASHNDVELSIDWLIDRKLVSGIGNCGFSEPKGLYWDVWAGARAKNFIQVRWDGEDQFNITLAEVLDYLKNGKKRDVQLSLL
jgi:hypothetical protein